MIGEETKGRYLDPDSVDAYNRDQEAKRKKRKKSILRLQIFRNIFQTMKC